MAQDYNFTPRARRGLELARKEAEKYQSASVSDVHLELAMVVLAAGSHFSVWEKLNFDVEVFEKCLRSMAEKAPKDVQGVIPIPYSAEIRQLLGLADLEAKALNHSWLGTEHILLAHFKLGTPAAHVLEDLRLSYDQVLSAILEMYDKANDERAASLDAEDNGFHVLIDPGSATCDEIAEVFEAISELNRAVGGIGMMFVDSPTESKSIVGIYY
jgi:ATP-dependent Clp protease ATP-binding subunit ClpC